MDRLTVGDRDGIERAAHVLADAFHDDPAYVWIFPRAEGRRAALAFLFGCNLAMHAPLGTCRARRGGDGDRVEAACIWCPPGRTFGLWTYLRIGLVRMPFRFGLGAVQRLLHADGRIKAIKRQHAPAPACWYLDTLGVAPEAQGRGLGAASLKTFLAEEVDPGGSPATLFTSNEVNLPFYRRHGFEVRYEERVGGEDGFMLWYMARPVPTGR